jgi:hypothetical protein
MATSSPRVAKAFLRYASPFSKLRTIPVFGSLLRKTSRALIPPDTLVWVQIEQGPGAGLWVCVNARTGRNVMRGEGEVFESRASGSMFRSKLLFSSRPIHPARSETPHIHPWLPQSKR